MRQNVTVWMSTPDLGSFATVTTGAGATMALGALRVCGAQAEPGSAESVFGATATLQVAATVAPTWKDVVLIAAPADDPNPETTAAAARPSETLNAFKNPTPHARLFSAPRP